MVTLTAADASARTDGRHWRVLLGRLHATFRTGSFTRGLELVQRVAELAEHAGHHPDVDLRYASVHLGLVSHDVGGLTERDVALSHQISRVADDMGLEADTAAPQVAEIAIDALDIPSVVPFWRAVMGYGDGRPAGPDASGELVDPGGVGPTLWFQQMDAPRPQRNRVHLDVSVPHDVAEERVRAALAAGGRLLSDERAPAFWVLADPEGNEACICTWQARED